MADPRDRDPVDAWLNAEVEPLTPPPGTFERIRHRARRRRAGRAMMSAAGIAIVSAAAVTVPRISSSILQSHNGPQRPVAANTSPLVRPSTPYRGNESPNGASPTPLPPPTSSFSPGGTSGEPVPRNFRPTSVTFISQASGAVIGQAGTPGTCPIVSTDCTSLAGTSDYGAPCHGGTPPVTGGPGRRFRGRPAPVPQPPRRGGGRAGPGG